MSALSLLGGRGGRVVSSRFTWEEMCGSMTPSSRFVLGEHDNRTVSFWFDFGGSGGIPVSSSFILGGSGGRSMSSLVLGGSGGRCMSSLVMGGSGGRSMSSSFILGGSGGRSMSSSFILGGSGGRSTFSSFILVGSGGRVSPPSSCSSMLSDSLGSKRMSSFENCCGGMGGGLPRGLWELDVASSLAGRGNRCE